MINNLSDFIGKEEIIKSIKIGIKASQKSNKVLDHILLYGPAGVGKTSLAMAIAKELNMPIKVIQGANIQNIEDMIGILSNLKSNSILFIDEIHSIKTKIAELLYPAMENKFLELIIGKNMYKRSIKLPFPNITIIAATTNLGNITKSLEERFNYIFFLDSYTDLEIQKIIDKFSSEMNLSFSKSEKSEIVNASRGIPRNTLKIIKRALAYKLAEEEKDIKRIIFECGFLYKGLQKIDIKYLNILYKKKFASLQNIIYSLNLDEKTIINKIEPYLYSNNLIEKNNRGRYLTEEGEKLVKEINELN